MAELSVEIIEGPGAGLQVPIRGGVEIGRDVGVALPLSDGLVSRHHARIFAFEDGAVVEDLDSLNGTFVNGNQIHSPTRVGPGDHLLVGVTVLEIRSPQQIADRPSAVRAIPPALAVLARRPDYISSQLLKEPITELDPLLDVRTKAKAMTAPLAVLLLAVIVVLLFLANRS